MKKSILNSVLKNVLFIGIIFLLFVPMMAIRYEWFDFSTLGGSYSESDNPKFVTEKWFEGKYQTQKEKYMGETMVFKPLFVRLYNQYYFDLFDVARANLVEVGKASYLYEKQYIEAFLGRDFIGYEKIEDKVKKLQQITDTLKTKEVELIVILAPGKASFYPEYIPDHFNLNQKTITNFEVYNENILKTSIHYLDFNSWFVNMKSTSEYPLFPKTGIHWSKYGEILVADSMLRYINSILVDKQAPHLIIGDISISDSMRDTDDDIEKGMNLYRDIPDLEMGYPSYSFQDDSLFKQPRIVTVADSYFWGMFNWGLSQKAFDDGQFWYYNKAIYPDSYKKPIKVSDINIIDEVEKNDVVILMSTDANLSKFAFGFIDQLHSAYFPSEKPLQ